MLKVIFFILAINFVVGFIVLTKVTIRSCGEFEAELNKIFDKANTSMFERICWLFYIVFRLPCCMIGNIIKKLK